MGIETNTPIRSFIHVPDSFEIKDIPKLKLPGSAVDKADFAKKLSQAVAEVDSDLKEADNKTTGFLEGKVGIHEMAIALEKADLSLRLLTHVRNRIIDAYKEVSRM